MKIKVKIKKITQIKLYLFVLVLIISALAFNAWTYKASEVEFRKEHKLISGRTIETIDGQTVVIGKDLNPFTELDYIGYVKNDTIISYRGKLSKIAEFVYMFGSHDEYYLYSCEETEAIKNKKSDAYKQERNEIEHINSYLVGWFWAFTSIILILFLVTTVISLFIEKGRKSVFMPGLKILYRLLTTLLLLIVSYYFMNYAFWLVIIPIFVSWIEIILHFSKIDKIMTDNGYNKSLIKDKKDKLHENFLSLIEPKKEKKKKTEKIIHF